jgi:two-component system, chemotaxis family, CheB/CheR fusion protein
MTRRAAEEGKSGALSPHVPVVAIGGSVGALQAFTELLGHVPADTGMAFVVLQHLDPRRDSLLAHLLRTPSRMPVREACDSMTLEPNHVYVVPSAHGASYAKGKLRLGARRLPAVPSDLIDGFMRSLAAAQGSCAIGIVLSGNGRDGVEGLSAIRAAGGTTFCQKPATAGSDAMPRAAMAAGVADFVLDPERIALELSRIGKAMSGSGQGGSDADAADGAARGQDAAPSASELSQVFSFLRASSGVDFDDYKPATLRRRIQRRMQITHHAELCAYLAHLRSDPKEAEALHTDLLIGVTSFFRDANAFSALKSKILPPLVEACDERQGLRIWVAGCATGQEPYSIAMCVLECFGEHSPGKSVQIFATDVREASIAWARAGLYPDAIRHELSPERLRRFFVRHGDGFQVTREVRDLCTFARHDLVADPAFSKLNLITCRNVLIYFEAAAQQRVLSKFHYALLSEGTLLLGASESISDQSPLFECVAHRERIYKPRAPLSLGVRPVEAVLAPQPRVRKPCILPVMAYDVRKEADRVLLSRFVSAAILVDPQLQIVQFRGQTGPFMGPLSGAASLSVLKLVDEALLPALRYGLATVQRTKRGYRRKAIVAQLQGVPRELDLEIIPLRPPQTDELSCLIVFSEAPRVREGERARIGAVKGAAGRLIAQLREELALTRDHLQASLAEHESANESLRATLEELQSSNEELQVTNEELETGKEELQSTNEELTTAHDEVQMRNAELNQLIHDHLSLVESASIAAALFGPDLHLRRTTAVAAALLRLTPMDIGRPVADLAMGLVDCELAKCMADTIAREAASQVEVGNDAGQRYLLTMRPYRTVDGQADGLVLTIVDVTLLRTAEGALALAEQRIGALERAAFMGGVSN